MSHTSIRRRAVVAALFATALLAAVFTMGTFSAESAHAGTIGVCNIGDFKIPGGGLDTTSYLACVGAAALSPGADCPSGDVIIAGTVDSTSGPAGSGPTMTATGFADGSDVEITLCGSGAVASASAGCPSGSSVARSLGTFSADGSGNLNAAVVIPAGTPPGPYTLAATGFRANDLSQVAYAAIEVTCTTTTGTLPTTGSDSGRMIAIGAALIVLGGAAIFGSTRTRRTVPVETD